MGKVGNPNWKKGMKSACPTGRPKGRKNKLSGDVVANILDTARQLEEQGMSLVDRAQLDPDWYYEHFYKPLVPKNINLTGDLSVDVEIFIGPKKVN